MTEMSLVLLRCLSKCSRSNHQPCEPTIPCIRTMGSYGKAVMTGFICRLCSEQKKKVIHLYSGKAKKLELMQKIKLLPISIEKYDNLPKTVCEQCIERLEIQYNLLLKIKKTNALQRKHRLFHSNGRCPVECPLHGVLDSSWAGLDPDEL